MNLGQIIILAAYIIGHTIGTVIIIKYQNERNKTLRSQIETLHKQIESQSGILQQVERFMNIFKVDEVEKYVEMSRKKFLLENEDKIRAIKEQLYKRTKSIKMFGDEILELTNVLFMLSSTFAGNSFFEKTINDMKDVTAKPFLLKQINKRKKELAAQYIAPLEYFAQIGKPMQALEPLLKRLEKSFEQRKKPPSSKK